MVRKLISKIKTVTLIHPTYIRYFKNEQIKGKTILIETIQGSEFSGHGYHLAKEILKSYPDFKVYVAIKNIQEGKSFSERDGFAQVKIVKHMSKQYLKLLASVEYLISDTSFYSFFIKKTGQTYINFWHGTPLKKLGQDMDDITESANVGRNFYMVDKIIVNNEFLAKTLASSYGLNGIYQGKVVIAPSVRNSVLMSKIIRENVRKKFNFADKKIVFYMPTWRGKVGDVITDEEKLNKDMTNISNNLPEDTLFFVKLHPFSKAINFNEFSNISQIPDDIELYEFLAAVDVLVTDYSSIMYDFVCTNRPVILYTYDLEEYITTRGVYDDINRYPFKQVKTAEELVKVVGAQLGVDYQVMMDEFCPVETEEGAKIVCDYIFSNLKHEKIKEEIISNGKETVFVFSGGFWDNGVTTALLNTFDNIDLSKRNYVVMLGQKQLKKEYAFRVRNLPKEVIFYPFPEAMAAGIVERVIYLAYMKFEWFDGAWIRRRVANVAKIDYKRIVGDLKIDSLIHYTGFGNRYSELLKNAPEEVNTVMCVHTDMIAEYDAKQNFSKKIIFSTYEKVNKVAVVHRNLKAGLIEAVPAVANKLYVMNNFLGEERVRELAKFDVLDTLKDTKMEHGDKQELISQLQNADLAFFINIGRFDYSKGHDRLIKAFEMVYKKNNYARLVIVAPHGPLRDKTLTDIENSPASAGIFVLGRMDNPYPLLAACDCFVLSSYYEGLGLVVYEALAVGIEIVTVDLVETTEYLKKGEGIIVEGSVEGIAYGMYRFLKLDFRWTFLDFSVLKERSILEFEQLLQCEKKF